MKNRSTETSDNEGEKKKIIVINRSNLNPNSLPVILLGQVSGRIDCRTGSQQSEKNNPSTFTTDPT